MASPKSYELYLLATDVSCISTVYKNLSAMVTDYAYPRRTVVSRTSGNMCLNCICVMEFNTVFPYKKKFVFKKTALHSLLYSECD